MPRLFVGVLAFWECPAITGRDAGERSSPGGSPQAFIMPAPSGGSPFGSIAGRWHDLAGRKLAFYAELHRSGRWRLYFKSREEFVVHLNAAMRVENIWARLAGRQAADDAVRPAA